jgi:tRNA(Ile)-lysidine synthase
MTTVTQDIYNRVKEFIIDKSLILPGERVLLSLSAGKDSMAMFHLMEKMSDELGFQIGVFHLNHMMRGEESDEDERHVRALAEKCGGIECHIKSYDFPAAKNKMSYEEHAREVRYRLLEETAESGNYHRIATAHSLDDHIETIIMRIFTGTGIYGLRGIPPRREKIIRPLIKIKSDEIYACLNEKGIAWREDSSNRDVRILRNNIRENLVPAIRSIFPSYDTILERLSGQAEENSELLEQLLSQSYGNLIEIENGNIYVRISEFHDNEMILKYIISYVLRKHFNEFSSSRMLSEAVKNIRRNRSYLPVYSNERVSIKKCTRNREEAISFSQGNKAKQVIGEWEYEVDLGSLQQLEIKETGMVLEIETVNYNYFKKNRHTNNIFVSIDTGICSIIIRNRRNGDRIILGCGSKKIKDLLIEKKLDNVTKNCVPLIIINSSVAACLTGILNGHENVVAAGNFATDKSERILRIQTAIRRV